MRTSGSSASAGADAFADAVEVGRAGAAVDEREAVEERGRAEASDDQVLEPGLEGGPPPQGGATKDVEGHRQQLEPDEEDDQVLRHREDRHAQDGGDEKGLELAVPPGARGVVGRLLAPAERDYEDGAGDRDQRRDQRQVVEPKRAGHEVLFLAELPDREAGRRPVGKEAHRGDEGALTSSHQTDEEHADEAGGQRDDHRYARVVDFRSGEGQAHGRATSPSVSCAGATAPTLSCTDASPRFRIREG